MSAASEQLLRDSWQARREGRPKDAKVIAMAAVELCQDLTSARLPLADAFTALAQVERDLGEHDKSLSHYENAAAIYREEGQVLRVAHSVRHLADIHRKQGNFEAAQAFYTQALDLYDAEQASAPPLDLANALRGMALLKESTGKRAEAKVLWEKAHALYSRVGVPAGVAESSQRIASLTA